MVTEPRSPEAIDRAFVPRLHERVTFIPVSGAGILYIEETGRLHWVDEVGAIVCECLDGRTTVGETAERLAITFDRDPCVVEADVVTFVRELGRLGLLGGSASEPTTSGGQLG